MDRIRIGYFSLPKRFLYDVKQRHYCTDAIIVFVAWIFEYGIKMYIDVKQSKLWTIAYNFYSFGVSRILKHTVQV